MSEEKDLPLEVLGLIFEHVLREDEKQCVWCHKVFYWVMGGSAALALRSTCRRWRAAFLHHVLLKGFNCERVPWCVSPSTCAQFYLRWVNNRGSKCKPIFHIVERDRWRRINAFIAATIPMADDSSEESGSESRAAAENE